MLSFLIASASPSPVAKLQESLSARQWKILMKTELNKLISEDLESKRDIDVQHAMYQIFFFLQINYRMGVNPLDPLRKIFPDFDWRFQKCVFHEFRPGDDEEDVPEATLHRFFLDSHFIWNCEINGYVSAKRKVKHGRRYAFGCSGVNMGAEIESLFVHFFQPEDGEISEPEVTLTNFLGN